MARMIDADKLAEVLHADKIFDVPNEYWDSAFGVPIVDAEIVVRCKDCKYWITDSYYHSCGLLNIVVNNGAFFCAGGEREEQNECLR